jgi:hypothetical protein
MQRCVAIVALLLALAAPCAVGSDGATPIWEPVDITEPGLYRLTRNFPPGGSGQLRILVDHVELDLNGFVLEAESQDATLWIAPDVQDVYIHDGTVSNTGSYLSALAISAGPVSHLRIERVHVRAYHSISVTAGDHISLCNSSIDGDPYLESVSGLVESNTVRSGVFQMAGDYTIVRGNTVRGHLGIGGENNLVADNIVNGLSLGEGTGNHLLRNISTYATGIVIVSDYNYIEGNVIEGNGGGGLWISGNHNVYRGNVSRNNTSPTPCPTGGGSADFCDEGTGNTSHGDNYMPGAM